MALFAAEISTADAVLFMLSTSLSRDLYQAAFRPDADDATLLRVGRLAAAAGGVLGVALGLVLPSVATALTLFYSVMTAALFVPLLAGLFTSRPGAIHARVAVGVSVVTTFGLRALLGGVGAGAWLPALAGMGAAALVFAAAWLGGAERVHARGEGTGA